MAMIKWLPRPPDLNPLIFICGDRRQRFWCAFYIKGYLTTKSAVFLDFVQKVFPVYSLAVR